MKVRGIAGLLALGLILVTIGIMAVVSFAQLAHTKPKSRRIQNRIRLTIAARYCCQRLWRIMKTGLLRKYREFRLWRSRAAYAMSYRMTRSSAMRENEPRRMNNVHGLWGWRTIFGRSLCSMTNGFIRWITTRKNRRISPSGLTRCRKARLQLLITEECSQVLAARSGLDRWWK